jgi:tetratricopeptide (TPR) repeat protein
MDAQAYELYLKGVSKIEEMGEGGSGAFAEGRALLERALAIQPSAEVYAGLSRLFLVAVDAGSNPVPENLALSRHYLEKGEALKRDYLPLTNCRIFLDIQQGEVERALALATDQLMADRLSLESISRIGLVLRHNGDFELAGAFYGHALKLSPRDFTFQLNDARTTFQGGDHERGLAAMQACAQEHPQWYWPRLYVAYYSLMEGQTSQAEETLARLPGSRIPTQLVSYQLGALRGRPEQFEPRRAALDLARIDFDTAMLLAECYSLAGDTHSSLENLQHALRLGWIAWSYFDWDPLLAHLRQTPEYQRLRAQGLGEQRARQQRERALVEPVMRKLGIAVPSLR